MVRIAANALWALVALVALAAGAVQGFAKANPDVDDTRPRLAFVIGNSHYQSARYPTLPNAANDADRLSETLERLKFQVVKAVDATSTQFADLMKQYEGKLDSYSAVLIFYSGHAIQYKGENYLLPVDTLEPDNIDKLIERTIRLNDLISRLSSRDRPTLIFLDACRNSPLGDGTVSGLAKVEAGENNYVAFATRPGKFTLDGTGDNSPFTKAMLGAMEMPGLDVSNMMIRVRTETERATLGQQSPWEQSNLRAQFYFTEQQNIDPQELNSMLNRILGDPKLLDQLKVQMASAGDAADLQTAVLMIGKQNNETVRAVSLTEAADSAQTATSAIAGDVRPATAVSAASADAPAPVLILGASEPAASGGKTAVSEQGHAVVASAVSPSAESAVAAQPAPSQPTVGQTALTAKVAAEARVAVPAAGQVGVVAPTQRVTTPVGGQIAIPAQNPALVPSMAGVATAKAAPGVSVASNDPSIGVKTAMAQILLLGIEPEDEKAPATGKTAPTGDQVAAATDAVGKPVPAEPSQKDVARRVQAGLARVGCYRQAVSGTWDKGSRKALADYFQHTGQGGQALDPSLDVLGDLFLRSGRICRQPVVIKPEKVAVNKPAKPSVPKKAGALANDPNAIKARLKSNQKDPGTVAVPIGIN